MIHYLELRFRGSTVQVVVNGLKLVRLDGGTGASSSRPLDTHLVGENNEVTIQIAPDELDSGEVSTVSDVTLVGTIKTYSSDGVVAPEKGDVLKEFDFDKIVAQRQEELAEQFDPTGVEGEPSPPEVTLPIEHSFTFDNTGASFRERLLEGTEITDEQRLRDYAERLLSLVSEKQAEALAQEFKPKLNDYSTLHPDSGKNFVEEFPTFLREEFFPGRPITEFGRSDVGLRSWCEGRIWELFVKPDQPFLKTKGVDGTSNEIPVYVGAVDGRLKVVR